MTDIEMKQKLLSVWLETHLPGHTALLFDSRGSVKVTPDAGELLARTEARGSPVLYIMLVGATAMHGVPVYVGKATSVMKRWKSGHLVGLRRAFAGRGTALYRRWFELLTANTHPVWLMCIAEADIASPLLPDFPSSVGALEYQLVSLVADVYPTTLLNREGVPR